MTTKWKAAKAAWHWPKDLSLKMALLQKTWWRVVVSMDSEGVGLGRGGIESLRVCP